MRGAILPWPKNSIRIAIATALALSMAGGMNWGASLVLRFGVFLTGVSIGSDTNYGQGDIEPYENYWHFWTKDSGQWEQAMFGASDHPLVNGGSDAWVFGSSTTPQNIPAPGAAVLIMASAFGARRRR